jgi:hypothetical protein
MLTGFVCTGFLYPPHPLAAKMRAPDKSELTHVLPSVQMNSLLSSIKDLLSYVFLIEG